MNKLKKNVSDLTGLMRFPRQIRNSYDPFDRAGSGKKSDTTAVPLLVISDFSSHPIIAKTRSELCQVNTFIRSIVLAPLTAK